MVRQVIEQHGDVLCEGWTLPTMGGGANKGGQCQWKGWWGCPVLVVGGRTGRDGQF